MSERGPGTSASEDQGRARPYDHRTIGCQNGTRFVDTVGPRVLLPTSLGTAVAALDGAGCALEVATNGVLDLSPRLALGPDERGGHDGMIR